ncbi:MAG TPA: hypothetical protein VNA65_11930 [Candidatus Dormibacteraeota bacterium]|nr:hypothetical protein [Candidatus Dormibacteraeota bacterium]
MARQDFSALVESGLLRTVERIVVEAVRAQGLSQTQAYDWLHYEDPDPVARLAEGVDKLRSRGAEFSAEAVDKACAKASKRGYLS